MDPLGNIYALNNMGAIEKYDALGNKRTVFTQNRLGKPASIYALHALKVLVWYPDFRTIVLLDRNLVQLGGSLNLIELGLQNVSVLAPAVDGNIWIYDEVSFKLLKISPEGNVITESQGLNLLLEKGVSIEALVDNGEQVIAYDSSVGFLVFDLFGQFKRQFFFPGPIEQLFVSGTRLQWLDTTNRFFQLEIGFAAGEKSWMLPGCIWDTKKKITANGLITWNTKGIQIWNR